MKVRQEFIGDYFKKIKTANKEAIKKEIFKDLLNRLYSENNELKKILDKISLGAEATIINIPREDKLHRGSADTLYNKIIIEFENDLKVNLKHAKEQLAGYLLGQFSSGEGYNFTLIASDFITWKVYALDVTQLDHFEGLNEDELILNEVASASFILTEHKFEDFYFWIDRFLFKEQKQRASLKRVEESFGYQSNVFIDSFRELTKHFNEVKESGEVQVSYEQWNKFLSIAYGSFDASESNFLIHTYLSIFSKMLAYAVVSNDDYIDEDEMKGILSGSIFYRFNIQNFVDNDFFYWIESELNFRKLKKVFRLIAQEISSYDFNHVDEDILKGVYQELIDLDTRHSLGEYYTPDWLCERIVNEFDFKMPKKILDPACGSGSFLRAAIHRIKEQNPQIIVEELNDYIYGIDIHPLSVQIAKTTMLLALGRDITKAKKPVHINIILANTLLAPEGVKNLFGSEFIMQIDKEKLWLNTQVFEDVHLFDEALEVCEDLAEQSMHKKNETKQTFENNLYRRYKIGEVNQQTIDSFYQIYETLKLVKEKGRDSIWKFIVQNLYKPYFLNNKFDYVIGNPPWLTYSSIKNEEYQNQLNLLAEKYNVKPLSSKNFPNLEIAAIFMSYCSSYFLKESGKQCFVLPRSFFSADHHDNTRSGWRIRSILTP
jgi:methylase of polypeptide subunit release factors